MESQELPIGLRVGSYELVARIGEGGMGTVYAAVHVGLGKRVAIKTLRTAFAADDDVRARFVREGKAAVAVRHPNVVDVDDVGVHEGIPYLVMELLEGESLAAMLGRRQRLSPQETADIVVPVLSAMAESHRAGVVHRDLKPDNIFLARGAGGLPVPKVLDFGISKLLETQSFRLTGEKAMLGTPYYMAPEQASSARDVDARSDLYAIGVILYHALSGRVPFAGSSLAQVLSLILHAPPVPLQERAPDVPPALERVVLRAMEKDPALRFQDARSLGRALLPFASERIVLTYRAELEGAAVSGGGQPVYDRTAAVNTTLSSAVRSVATTSAPTAWKVLPWAASLAALALVGAMLAFWPRTTAPRETTVSPAQQPSAQLPPTAAAPEPPERPIQPSSPIQVQEEEPSASELTPSPKDTRSAGTTKAKRPKPKPPAPVVLPEPKSQDDIWGDRK
jgi:eukaryotic-like serine/threonine-protein kinase